jgi:hypothetical protein
MFETMTTRQLRKLAQDLRKMPPPTDSRDAYALGRTLYRVQGVILERELPGYVDPPIVVVL